MTASTCTWRRLLLIVPLSLLILMIGLRYVVERTGVPHFAGWLLVIGSLLTLSGYVLALLPRRRD